MICFGSYLKKYIEFFLHVAHKNWFDAIVKIRFIWSGNDIRETKVSIYTVVTNKLIICALITRSFIPSCSLIDHRFHSLKIPPRKIAPRVYHVTNRFLNDISIFAPSQTRSHCKWGSWRCNAEKSADMWTVEWKRERFSRIDIKTRLACVGQLMLVMLQ